MATEVIMPKLGFDVERARLARWLKHEGDQVNKGDVLAEVETEKVTLEVEAYDSGTLLKIVAPEGAEVPVGQAIAYLGQPGEHVEAAAAAPQAAPAEAAPPPPPPAAVAPAPPPGPLRVSPVAEALARERGVDLTTITGTGPGGRITKDDVLAATQAAPQPAPEKPAPAPAAAVEPSPMRRAIARKMTESKPGIPHFYVTVQVDMTDALALRAQLNGQLPEDDRLSVNDLVIRAVAVALADFPDLNAWYVDGRLERKPQVNVGVAIALDEGLIAPAVLDCGGKGLLTISREARRLAEHARAGKISPEQYAEATITLSNLGMFGVESFHAIIVPPQVAIIAVGAARPTAVPGPDGQITVRPMMSVTLSADHRVTDGAVGARFVGRLQELLQQPARLLL